MAKRREKLPCGCRISLGVYKYSPNNWGRVDVDPTCEKKSHRKDLDDLTRMTIK